jgi:Tol biopolymer transport system component
LDTRKALAALCVATAVLLLAGCDVGGTRAPTPTVMPLSTARASDTPILPTSTAVPTVEPQETVAPTVTPTHTPTPTAIPPTNTPAVTPAAAAGPATPAEHPPPSLEGRFVFQAASGGDIYAVNADGSGLRRLTQGMDPSWSPDGKQVVFARWTEPWGIYAITADGSNERLLFSSSVARSPVFSPDGSQIAFHFTTEGWHPAWKFWIDGFGWYYIERGYKQTEWHLGVLNLADGRLHEPYCDNVSYSPTWTVDREWLVYDGEQGLMISEANGANNLPFADNPRDYFPVMSPDGSQVAIQHWQHDHWEIYIMNADGKGRRPLTGSSPLLERRPHNVSPAWSPDGSQIAFLSDRSGEWEFYVMDADGSNQMRILQEVTEQLDIQYVGGTERVISWTR